MIATRHVVMEYSGIPSVQKRPALKHFSAVLGPVNPVPDCPPANCQVPGPQQRGLLQAGQHVEEDVLEPGGALGDVDDVEEEDGGDDEVVDELGNRSPHPVYGAAEVRAHGEDPDQHGDVVESQEHEELLQVHREEDTEHKHPGYQTEVQDNTEESI